MDDKVAADALTRAKLDKTIRRIVECRPQNEHVATCEGAVVREGKHVHIPACDGNARGVCGLAIKRPDNDLCPFVDSLRSGQSGLLRVATGGVVDTQVNSCTLQVCNRKAGRIFKIPRQLVVGFLC